MGTFVNCEELTSDVLKFACVYRKRQTEEGKKAGTPGARGH